MIWLIAVIAVGVGIGIYEFMQETKLFPPEAAPYKGLVLAAAAAHGVPWQMMAAEIGQESGWDPNIINPASGASGIAQFEPSTAAPLGIDPFDPQSAIPGMARYLASLHAQLASRGFSQWSYALAAYDWGIGNVERALQDGTPPSSWPDETRHYVQVITSRSGVDTATAALFA